MTRILRTLALCLAVAFALPACAHDHRHHGNRHTNNDGDILGALIVGGVIGAAVINSQNQREVIVVQQPPVVVQPQPRCYRQPLYDNIGRFVMYRQICD